MAQNFEMKNYKDIFKIVHRFEKALEYQLHCIWICKHFSVKKNSVHAVIPTSRVS